MIIHRGIEQGSFEWHELRLGRVTASRVKDVMANGRGSSPSKTRETYMLELVTELLTGAKVDGYTNPSMEWGNETEPQARAMYELKNNIDVEEVTFISSGKNIGVSPDGIISNDGLIEIKCPNSLTQVRRALSDKYYKDYVKQIQMQLWISEREWCDFVSFDPRIYSDISYLEQRVYRDEDFINKMKVDVNNFVDEMLEIHERLTK